LRLKVAGGSTESAILSFLREKNGDFTTHAAWSLEREAAPRGFDKEFLRGFLSALRTHVDRRISLAFGGSAAGATGHLVEVIVTHPPWWTEGELGQFSDLLKKEGGAEVRLAAEPEACFAHYLSRTKGVKIAAGELLTVCSMEEEMTTISHYDVKGVMPVMKLTPKRCDVLLSGSSDVAMRFAELMERRLEGTVRELGLEADEVIAQLDKVWYCSLYIRSSSRS
jgi:hypothetical protein